LTLGRNLRLPLKVWRESRGLDRAALGATAGVAEHLIAPREAGEAPIDADALGRLAAALAIDADDLEDLDAVFGAAI
jgi:transcriptional regulator with XRE-family HTH domain